MLSTRTNNRSFIRIAFLFQIFLFLISPFPFLAQCHVLLMASSLILLARSAVGEWPLMSAIKGLALAIWGSRHTANAFMRTLNQIAGLRHKNDSRFVVCDRAATQGIKGLSPRKRVTFDVLLYLSYFYTHKYT